MTFEITIPKPSIQSIVALIAAAAVSALLLAVVLI